MYLLDTCAVSDFIKGEKGTLQRIKALSPYALFLSSINSMEITYGLLHHPQKARQIFPILREFMEAINVLDFTRKDAQKAAEIRHFLAEKGRPIGPYDVLIAGVALNRQLILVTSNVREFERIPDLNLENWRL